MAFELKKVVVKKSWYKVKSFLQAVKKNLQGIEIRDNSPQQITLYCKLKEDLYGLELIQLKK